MSFAPRLFSYQRRFHGLVVCGPPWPWAFGFVLDSVGRLGVRVFLYKEVFMLTRRAAIATVAGGGAVMLTPALAEAKAQSERDGHLREAARLAAELSPRSPWVPVSIVDYCEAGCPTNSMWVNIAAIVSITQRSDGQLRVRLLSGDTSFIAPEHADHFLRELRIKP